MPANLLWPVSAPLLYPRLPVYAVLSTRTALNFPCIVYLTSRRALVWGIIPHRSAPTKGHRLCDEPGRAGVVPVSQKRKGEEASRPSIP
jgi:hypothetical protein